jgi:hypothetical protein
MKYEFLVNFTTKENIDLIKLKNPPPMAVVMS